MGADKFKLDLATISRRTSVTYIHQKEGNGHGQRHLKQRSSSSKHFMVQHGKKYIILVHIFIKEFLSACECLFLRQRNIRYIGIIRARNMHPLQYISPLYIYCKFYLL